MALERFDPVLERALHPVVRRLDGVSPDAVTWVGVAVGVVAAALVVGADASTPGRVALSACAVLLPLQYAIDVLDGTLARHWGRTSAWGDYLDHTADRVVDVAIVVALAASPAAACPSWVGFAVAVAMLLGSHAGTQSQASGLPRPLGGFSRFDRLAVLALAALVAGLGPPDWQAAACRTGLAVVALGGVYTLIARSLAARRALRSDQ